MIGGISIVAFHSEDGGGSWSRTSERHSRIDLQSTPFGHLDIPPERTGGAKEGYFVGFAKRFFN
jgi:hypothetical protein